MKFCGLEVIVTASALSSDWIPPVDPWVEYESSDEWWGRKYGFGKVEEKPCAYEMEGKTLLVHPEIWERLKREIRVFNTEMPMIVNPSILWGSF